jgi:hypothetical protein
MKPMGHGLHNLKAKNEKLFTKPRVGFITVA